MDELVMAHTLSYRDRLELSAPTLPVTDLLLSKLQVHEMTANDLIDMTILLLEHETSDSPQPDVIHRAQITFDYEDPRTGEEVRGVIRPATREAKHPAQRGL